MSASGLSTSLSEADFSCYKNGLNRIYDRLTGSRGVLVLRRAGSPETKEFNTRAGQHIVDIGHEAEDRLTIEHGGYNEKGEYRSELYLRPKGHLLHPADPRRNASYADLAIYNQGSKRWLLVNSATPDQRRPMKPGAWRRGYKLMVNSDDGAVVLIILKPEKGADQMERIRDAEPAMRAALSELRKRWRPRK